MAARPESEHRWFCCAGPNDQDDEPPHHLERARSWRDADGATRGRALVELLELADRIPTRRRRDRRSDFPGLRSKA